MRLKKPTRIAATCVVVLWAAPAGIANADPPLPPAQPKTTIDSDGTFLVGTAIAPGTYRSAGPIGTGSCYWKRLSSTNGSDIIDNAMTSHPQVVQIESSDVAFKTDGCQPWQRAEPGSGDGQPPPALPPLLAGAQLRALLGTLNAGAGQLGGEQSPWP